MDTLLTMADVKRVVAAWGDDLLDRRNPDARGCLSTYPDGSHCMVAQIFVDLGLEIAEGYCTVYPGNLCFDRSALSKLRDMQGQADYCGEDIFNPALRPTWREVLTNAGILT